MAEAYERKGEREQAGAAYERFLQNWKHGDVDVPEIENAGKKMSTRILAMLLGAAVKGLTHPQRAIVSTVVQNQIRTGTFLGIIGILPIYPADLHAAPLPKSAIRLERSVEAMGTSFVIEIYGTDEHLMQSAADKAFAELHRVDGMLSNYIPSSELSRVNECAGKTPIKVSREFFGLLKACERYSRKSDGSFDITVGPLMKIWGFYKGSGRLPSNSEIRVALNNVGYQNLKLDSRHLTVRFKKPGVDLDPGGVGKGYAVDRMVTVLLKNGIGSGLVSAGGSSIFGIGAPPSDPRGWYIRIRDPKEENRNAAEVYLKNNSISTSGSYEKFFWADGRLYSHIMDPRTGYPSEGMLAVSVVSPRTLDSEIWAKPYYILGAAWTERHRPRDFRILMCEDKPGAACAWLP